MSDGCYDIDGKCVNCGGFHPCSCEAEKPSCPECDGSNTFKTTLFNDEGCNDCEILWKEASL